MLLRILTAIQLTRLTMAFGAVSDIWFVILLTKAHQEYVMVDVYGMAMVAALLAGAIVAVGLFAYGGSLNDILDVRHDSAFSPERPIPAGRIKVSQAVIVAVGALIVAVLGGAWMGTGAVCLTLLAAAGLLFYNATGKFIPSVGVVTVGLVHAVHMLVPNYQLTFLLPVWLVMTHAMVITAIVHVLEDKRPRLTSRAVVAVVIGWAVWSFLIIGAGGLREPGLWPEDANVLGLFYPLLAVISFAFMAWWKTSRAGGRNAAEKLKRYGAMWQSLYGAAWLLAIGLNTQAMWLGAFAVAGFMCMTLIRELTGLSGQPMTYRD
ncbi:MAG: UbiA family prenyltransferase [Phycisphaerales bacterium]|nr:MAG: UbiA family prenyltransferase [Phycisphaerales bacterium]